MRLTLERRSFGGGELVVVDVEPAQDLNGALLESAVNAPEKRCLMYFSAGKGIVLAALLILWGMGMYTRASSRAECRKGRCRLCALRMRHKRRDWTLSHVSGGPQQRYILEAMGSGVAFFDFDADGWLDVVRRQWYPCGGCAGDGQPPLAQCPGPPTVSGRLPR